jgi:RinA family phage transcriptional activator
MIPRAYFRATEQALYEYPSIKKALRQREDWLESHSGEYILVGKCSVRPISRYQESVVIKKEHDYKYLSLAMKLQAIQDGVEYLRDLQKDLIAMYYWQGLSRIEVACELNISEREFFRQRRRAIEHVARKLWGPFVESDD